MLCLVGMSKNELKMISKVAEDAQNMKKPVCLIFSSEITTEVTGGGMGGPCQEVALATAIELKRRYDSHDSLRVRLMSISSWSHKYHNI